MEFGISARRVTLGCCAVLVVAGTVADPAAAAPQSGGPALPPGLVEAVQRDLGIDADDYLARSTTAQRLAEFGDVARRAYPAIFAGVRMDGIRPVVSLVDGEDADDARAAADQAGFTVETVTESEAALDGRRAAFEHWLAGQNASVTDSIVGYGIDEAHDSLEVTVAKDIRVPADVGPVRSVSAVMPEARPDGNPATAQVIADVGPDDDDVVGGEPFAIELAGRTHKCSFGFNGTDADGHTVNITAGHCDPNNLVEPAAKTKQAPRVYEGAGGRRGRELGRFEFSELGPHDYSIVRVDDSVASRFQNNLVSTRRLASPAPAAGSSGIRPPAGSSGTRPLAGSSGLRSSSAATTSSAPAVDTTGKDADQDLLRIDGVAKPVVGQPVCKSGFRSGYSCGTVLTVGQKGFLRGVPGHGTDVVTVQDMFYTDVCAQRGDSGGPIFAGTKALGVNSAIINYSTPLDQGCGHLPVLLGQPLSSVLDDHPGLIIRTE
ncbi:S1 family peptidase [Nocardia alni]|uniref:S1 family peptidase n=1 Tax=Nocardia alni TaxID=2815723 RepID=UPI001C23D642|nr:S1 family peptidase [Nocardia alni]